MRDVAALLSFNLRLCSALLLSSYAHSTLTLFRKNQPKMLASSISLLLLALFFRSVEAGIRFNAPNGNTTWDATKPQYIKWRESGSAGNRTTLQQLGSLSVTLWAGSSSGGKTQVAEVCPFTLLRTLLWLTSFHQLGTVAATAKELQVNLPANAGASGGVYFIHFASTSMPDNVYDSSK